MSFSPFARYRNFTLDNLKSLLELYPDAFNQMTWNEAGDIIEEKQNGYRKTAYQQACQFGLEDRSGENYRIQDYLYSFEDENLKRYLEFWACTYFAPNPYVNSSDNSIIFFCEIGKQIIADNNLSVDYDDFFNHYIGGKSNDILLNILKSYCYPLKYNKDNNNLYIDSENIVYLKGKIELIEKEFPILNSKDRKEFFERYSYKSFCKYYNYIINRLDKVDNIEQLNVIGYNKLYYGIPGCGKSYYIEHHDLASVDKKHNVFRTTFYLDYSNSDFIGQIYPIVKGEKVEYQPVPGPFTKALARAFDLKQKNVNDMVYLVIEEINRGNAAAIFGDTFQLLDRLKEPNDGRLPGDSEYPISNEFIEGYFEKEGIAYEKGQIYIPHNLTILATMNTSDQNVFPLDTAFKRRWNRQLMKGNWENCDFKDYLIPGTSLTWQQFANAINNRISNDNNGGTVMEDKKLGPFFASEGMFINPGDTDHSNDGDKLRMFIENVMDYLYSDVCKFDKGYLFESGVTFNKICDLAEHFNGDEAIPSEYLYLKKDLFTNEDEVKDDESDN